MKEAGGLQPEGALLGPRLPGSPLRCGLSSSSGNWFEGHSYAQREGQPCAGTLPPGRHHPDSACPRAGCTGEWRSPGHCGRTPPWASEGRRVGSPCVPGPGRRLPWAPSPARCLHGPQRGVTEAELWVCRPRPTGVASSPRRIGARISVPVRNAACAGGTSLSCALPPPCLTEGSPVPSPSSTSSGPCLCVCPVAPRLALCPQDCWRHRGRAAGRALSAFVK